MQLDRNAWHVDPIVRVRLVRTGPGTYDILSMRQRMVLRTNVSMLDAQRICLKKGWVIVSD
jgi:hypothetical protein